MRTVLKYPLSLGITKLGLESGAKVLHVGEQNGDLMLWAEVDRDYPADTVRTFSVIGTGGDVPPTGEYVGTVLVDTVFVGALVWHIYEVM